jgi:C4-dicarboxylate transporter
MKELKAQSKRKDIIIIILIGVILAMIIAFFIYENQFEVVADTETTTVDGGENGIATYLENSESGDINYGENNQN